MFKFFDNDVVMEKICDFVFFLDVFFIVFYGFMEVGVKVGLMVYIVGVGFVGCVVVVVVCFIGVVVIIVGDYDKE